MNLRSMLMILTFGLVACAAAAQQSMADMPGMQMDSTKPVPTDSVSKSIQGVEQQAEQQKEKPTESSDASSIVLPIQEMQEPEAPDFRTGTELPAPELLQEFAHKQPLTLESFLRMAEHDNPTLAEAQRSVDRSGQQARQASLPPNPTFGYSGDHIRGGEYGGGEEGAFFAQEFVLDHKLRLRRDVYRAEGRSNELAVEIQRARIRNDVGRTFFDALGAQESVVIYDRLLKVTLDAERNAHELERVGQADASDVLNAEIASEQAKADFESAQRTFLAAFTQLGTYAGQTSMSPHPLTGSLVEPPEMDAESLVGSSVQDSPAVKQAQADVLLAEARVTAAKREKVPNLTVKAGEWYSGERLGATNIKAGPESFVEAGVQLPLWNRNQGNVEVSKVTLEQAHDDVARIQLLTRNRAEGYAQEYQTARSTAGRYRNEMIPRARRAYELEVTKYQEMGQTYSHVLAAQRMLFTLQLAYIRALRDEWRAAIALQNYTLMDALDGPMSQGQNSSTINLPTGQGSGN